MRYHQVLPTNFESFYEVLSKMMDARPDVVVDWDDIQSLTNALRYYTALYALLHGGPTVDSFILVVYHLTSMTMRCLESLVWPTLYKVYIAGALYLF